MPQWQEMAAYIGFTERDSAVLRTLAPHAEPELARISDHFYETLLRFPVAAAVLADEAQTTRLRHTLIVWMRQMLQGPHDEPYWQRRLLIGKTHVRVGLPMRYMFTAMHLLREDLLEVALRCRDCDSYDELTRAITRITDLELAVMCSTYMAAHENAQLRSLQDTIVRSLPVTAMCLDRDGRVTAATRTGVATFGLSAVVGFHYEELLPADLVEAARIREHIARARSSGNEVSAPRVVVGRGPGARYFRVNVVPLFHELAEVLLHIEELTDVVNTEARAQRSEALARIGALATNVAHEIRNPLTAISTTLQVIERSLDEVDRRRGILRKVQQQVVRLDRLVTDLLGYARPADASLAVQTLGPLVEEALVLSGVRAELGGELSTAALCDGQLVQQILINLAQNARDAAGEGGAISVFVDAVGPAIEVEDSGPGVEAGMESQIFEAFVTTKSKGTGLGLAICRKLALAMDGNLELAGRSPGLGGARFRLNLQAPPDRVSPSDNEGYND